MPQDLPPTGGYEPVQYKVNKPPLSLHQNPETAATPLQSTHTHAHAQKANTQVFPLPAQHSGPGSPPHLLSPGDGYHRNVRLLQGRAGDQRAKVRLKSFSKTPHRGVGVFLPQKVRSESVHFYFDIFISFEEKLMSLNPVGEGFPGRWG